MGRAAEVTFLDLIVFTIVGLLIFVGLYLLWHSTAEASREWKR